MEESTCKVLHTYLKKKDKDSLLKAESRDDVKPILDMMCKLDSKASEERDRIRQGIVLVPPTKLENLYRALFQLIQQGEDSKALRDAIDKEWLYKEVE